MPGRQLIAVHCALRLEHWVLPRTTPGALRTNNASRAGRPLWQESQVARYGYGWNVRHIVGLMGDAAARNSAAVVLYLPSVD